MQWLDNIPDTATLLVTCVVYLLPFLLMKWPLISLHVAMYMALKFMFTHFSCSRDSYVTQSYQWDIKVSPGMGSHEAH